MGAMKQVYKDLMLKHLNDYKASNEMKNSFDELTKNMSERQLKLLYNILNTTVIVEKTEGK